MLRSNDGMYFSFYCQYISYLEHTLQKMYVFLVLKRGVWTFGTVAHSKNIFFGFCINASLACSLLILIQNSPELIDTLQL